MFSFRWIHKKKVGKYVKKVDDMADIMKSKPGLYHAVIKHDSYCKLLKGGRCNCDPSTEIYDDISWQDQEK